MSFVVGRFFFAAVFFFPLAARAVEWRFIDGITSPTTEHALICHLWNATVFAPGEKGSCYLGTIYAANLRTGEIGYAGIGDGQIPASRSDRELNRDTLIRSLRGEGITKLDALHEKFEAERLSVATAVEVERERAEADRARLEYFQSFETADTLSKIVSFETKYTNNDPDGLIPKLAPRRASLELQSYRDAYTSATTSAQLQAFIDAYASRDPDKLIPEARGRLARAKKQEILAQRAAEKKVKDDAIEQQAAAKQAALKKDARRLEYIRSLHAKYSSHIMAESPEGYRIVSNYRIDCRTGDGRVLPLLNALYASMSYEGNEVSIRFRIQNRGSQVRITSEVTKNGKPIGAPSVYYEINQWGELKAIAIRNEAVLNLCYGSHGTLWLMPGEPGYQ